MMDWWLDIEGFARFIFTRSIHLTFDYTNTTADDVALILSRERFGWNGNFEDNFRLLQGQTLIIQLYMV